MLNPIPPAIARLEESENTGNYLAEVLVAGEPATLDLDVAYALHAVFPNLRFNRGDIAPSEPEIGYWMVPIPTAVADIVVRQNLDFAWTEVVDRDDEGETLVSVHVPTF